MSHPPPRNATLVLCASSGEVLGALPPFEAGRAWWQDAGSLVQHVERHHGVRVVILRMLAVDRATPPGGNLVYLAEVDVELAGALPLSPWDGVIEPHPLRLPYAEPGGPARDLAWAEAELHRRGLSLRAPAEQVRTWNLSSLWRLPIDGGNAWVKHVPPFFAHEGDVLAILQDAPVPRLWAHDGGRILMPEIPGEDLYGAPLDTLLELVTMLVDLQSRWVARLDELLALGLPDWRAAPLSELVASVVRRNGSRLDDDDRRTLDDFVDSLLARFAAVASCGLPDSLVHGDFAPGNARGDGKELVLLDWGDCGVGHPLLDQSAFLDRIDSGLIERVAEHWTARWREQVPGSDPRRAAQLLAPVAAARQAVIYQGFLDRIEPSEHPHHHDDPPRWLSRAAALCRDQH